MGSTESNELPLPAPSAAPPIDPNAPTLNLAGVGGFLGALGPSSPPPMPDQGLAPGIGVPNATLDAAAAAGPPLPLGPDGQPLPLGANGAPALPDVGDQIGVPPGAELAPDGSISGAPSAPGSDNAPPGSPAAPTLASALGPFLSPFAGVPGALSNLVPEAPAPTLPDGDVIRDDARGREANAPEFDDFVEPKVPYDILNPDLGYSPQQQEDYLKRLAITNRPEFDAVVARHEQTRQLEADTAQLAAAKANNEKAREDLQIQQNAIAKAKADSDRNVADAKAQAAIRIDPSHYMNSRSSGQVLLDFIGAVAGGLAAGAVPGGNGTNHYLEIMKDRINNDIDAQAKNIANGWKGIDMEKSAVGENYARTGDLYRATETARLAAWESVKGEIATQAQQWDPRGTTAIASAHAYQQASAQQAAVANTMQQQLEKDNIERAKVGLEARKAQQAAAAKAIDQAAEQQRLKLEAWRTAEDVRKNKAGEALGTRKQDFDEWKGVSKAMAATAAKKGTIGGIVTGLDDNGKPKFTDENGQPAVMKQADGADWTPENFKAVAPVIASANMVNFLANKLTREINEWGGQSDLIRSDHWQTLTGDRAALTAELHKAEEIPGFKGGVVEMLKELEGDVNPTSFVRSAAAGIQNAKSLINERVDNIARTVGKYTGPQYSPVDTSVLPPVTKTDIDNEAANAATLNPVEQHGAALTFGGNEAARRLAANVGEASRQKSLSFIEAQLDKDDVTSRQNGLSSIAELIKTAPTAATKARAQEIWDKHAFDWVGKIEAPASKPKGGDKAKATPQSDLLAGLRKDLLSMDAEKRNLAVKMLMRLQAVHPTETEPSEAAEPNSSPAAEEGEE